MYRNILKNTDEAEGKKYILRRFLCVTCRKGLQQQISHIEAFYKNYIILYEDGIMNLRLYINKAMIYELYIRDTIDLYNLKDFCEKYIQSEYHLTEVEKFLFNIERGMQENIICKKCANHMQLLINTVDNFYRNYLMLKTCISDLENMINPNLNQSNVMSQGPIWNLELLVNGIEEMNSNLHLLASVAAEDQVRHYSQQERQPSSFISEVQVEQHSPNTSRTL
ncbi:hypothetical protein [Wolbachia endosymbiont of Pentidionis agamae]|uniref:hypothetical protein n=1 Tax=Wolbachia endosymbiont of Pentidionis agamae TaxID=3110435 RepID=UPI002FD58E91